ncbi:hypothetical protein [Ktedonobacter robiniae]|uniref:hypothetical protein n=1 Tax=Ktedonobacter robiniae TaxID=2778365 RepID=UPI001914F73F|nr:hypothetical protein [Ktedonobacter robiniae]
MIACFRYFPLAFWFREGNDNPHRMDYQRCKHPFTILYPLCPKGVRGYFAYDVASTVHVGIDLATIGCVVKSTHHPLPTKRVLLIFIIRVTHWQQVQVEQTGFCIGFPL